MKFIFFCTIAAVNFSRLTEKLKKSFLDCEDIMKITGLGQENVRRLMRSQQFPTTIVGRRKIVSISNFVVWFTEH